MTAVLAFTFSTALMPLAVACLRRWGTIDAPNERSSHVAPTPRGAGVALLVAGIAAVWLGESPPFGDSWALLVLVVLFGAVGLADDLRQGIHATVRAAACLVIAATLVPSLVHPESVQPIFLLAATIAIVGITNSFNFMDGINGISALHAMVYGLVLAQFASETNSPGLVRAAPIALVGCGLAFLPWNLVRARAFLGDVGSYGLGASAAALAIWLVAEEVPVLCVSTVFLPYLADTGFTVLRRIVRKERWWEPHREHAYQRLVDRGSPHWQVALGVASLSAFCGVCGLLAQTASTAVQLATFAFAASTAVAYATIPQLLHARSSNRRETI